MSQPSTAIILTGGLGTRLRKVVEALPKPLAPVRGRPFLDYQLHRLAQQGIRRVVLSTGYMAEIIKSHYPGAFEGMEIIHAEEKSALGTGGGIRLAMTECADPSVLVLNGDSMFDIDLDHFSTLHSKYAGNYSLALRRVEDGSRYGTVRLDSAKNITAFLEKGESSGPALINGGVYILNKELFLKNTPENAAFSIERDFFSGLPQGIKGFTFDNYFIDIGIPEDYARAQDEFERFAY